MSFIAFSIACCAGSLYFFYFFVWWLAMGAQDRKNVIEFLRCYGWVVLLVVCLASAVVGGLYYLHHLETEQCHRKCSPYASRTVGDTCECQNKSKHWVPQGHPGR